MVSRRAALESGTDYVEKRSVDLGDRSVTTAWLFVTLEEVRHPCFAKARKHCFDYLQYCSYNTQRLFSFLLDLRVAKVRLLTAWNRVEFIDAVIQASAELTGKLGCSDWEVVQGLGTALGFDSIETGGGCRTVYVREEEGRAVVMYCQREMDSFRIAPCGHIVPVYALEAQFQAKSSNDSLLCPHPNCQFDLSAFISRVIMERSTVQPPHSDVLTDIYSGAYLSSLDPSAGDQCVYCRREKGVEMCSNGCLVCSSCALIATFTPFQFRCPYCSERLKKQFYGQVLKQVESMGKLETLEMLCDVCWLAKPLAEYEESLSEDHACLLCSSCFAGSPQVCANCSLPRGKAVVSVGSEEQSSSGMRCSLCHKASTYSNFSTYFDISHPCQICDDCYLIYSSEQCTALTCPKCASHLPAVVHGKIGQIQSFRVNKGNASAKSWICGLCGVSKGQYETLISPKLGHSCLLCDTCIRQNLNMRQCIRCGGPYNEDDKAFLCAVFPQKAQKAGLCPCGNEANQDSIACKKRCFCSICNLKHFLLTKKAECPKCRTYCQNLPFSGYKCTSCHKTLDLDSASLSKSLSGICSNGCILCVYCTRIEGDKGKCSCGAEVELAGKTAQEVVTTQGSFQLGCFCGSIVGPRDAIKCGHEVHRECREFLPFCRVCDWNRQPLSERQGLRSYSEQASR